MSYIVQIRKNATGEIREHKEDKDWYFEDDDGEPMSELFFWTDGSCACDCNRFLFFERAGGNHPRFDTAACGETEYTAIKAILPDGTEIKIDKEKETV